jgi:hypothetical protein
MGQKIFWVGDYGQPIAKHFFKRSVFSRQLKLFSLIRLIELSLLKAES